MVGSLLLAGCIDHDPISPSANAVIVHAVLDAGSRDQYVMVASSTGVAFAEQPVAGAEVTLQLPDGRVVRAEEQHDTTRAAEFVAPTVQISYHFSLDRLGFNIEPGQTYYLRVVVPGGRVVTGHTTVPMASPVSLSVARESFDMLRDTLDLSWRRIAGARSYEVSVKAATRPFPLTFFADTSATLMGSRTNSDGWAFFLRGAEHLVVASAVDTNYYDYYRRGTDAFTGVSVITHLDGGIGLFGAIVELRVRRVLAH